MSRKLTSTQNAEQECWQFCSWMLKPGSNQDVLSVGGGWPNWHIHVMDYYSPMKRNEPEKANALSKVTQLNPGLHMEPKLLFPSPVLVTPHYCTTRNSMHNSNDNDQSNQEKTQEKSKGNLGIHIRDQGITLAHRQKRTVQCQFILNTIFACFRSF